MKRNWLISTVLVASIIGLCLSLQSCARNKINLRKTLDTKETMRVQAYWDPINPKLCSFYYSFSFGSVSNRQTPNF